MRFATVRDVVDRSLDRGITFFDTADSYGAGWSERWLGRALGRRRDEVMIATKCGHPATLTGKLLGRLPLPGWAPILPLISPGRLFSPRYIELAFQRSLRRLGTEYLDVLLLHSPPADVLNDETWVEAFVNLRDRGVIRFFGVSARTPEDAARAICNYEIDCVELELNPCTIAAAEPALALARERGTAVIGREIFGSGRLLNEVVSRLGGPDAGERRGETAAAALLEFALGIPNVTVALVGMSNVEQVDANASQSKPSPEFVSQVIEAARDACTSVGFAASSYRGSLEEAKAAGRPCRNDSSPSL